MGSRFDPRAAAFAGRIAAVPVVAAVPKRALVAVDFTVLAGLGRVPVPDSLIVALVPEGLAVAVGLLFVGAGVFTLVNLLRNKH